MPAKKCDGVLFCSALSNRMSHSWEGKKGLAFTELCSLETGATTYRYPVYKTKGIEKNPIAINFCPFCGFSFYENVYTKWNKSETV